MATVPEMNIKSKSDFMKKEEISLNFMDMCYELFQRISKIHDLSKDVDNYNKAIFYLNNFGDTDSKEIIDFIINVRADNIIYTAIQQLLKMYENIVINGMPPRTLYQLSPYELYNELKGEVFNIIEKGAFDSLKLLNDISSEQDEKLAERFVRGDMTIFTQYRCK